MIANFEFLICTEMSYDMDKDIVRGVINRGIPVFLDRMEAENVEICDFYARIIGFGDYSIGTDAVAVGEALPVMKSGEYYGTGALEAALDGLSFIGGVGRCNALEALYAALATPSCGTTGRTRRIIILLAESEVLPLEAHLRLDGYVGDAPDSMAELARWIDGKDPRRMRPMTALTLALISDRGENGKIKDSLTELPLTLVSTPDDAEFALSTVGYGILFEDW